MTNPTCKKCGSTNVTKHVSAENSVNIEYSTCESCQREFITRDQILSNEAKIRNAKCDISTSHPIGRTVAATMYQALGTVKPEDMAEGEWRRCMDWLSDVAQGVAVDELLPVECEQSKFDTGAVKCHFKIIGPTIWGGSGYQGLVGFAYDVIDYGRVVLHDEKGQMGIYDLSSLRLVMTFNTGK